MRKKREPEKGKEKGKPVSSLFILPDELLAHIFIYFSERELAVLALVCKEFKRLSEDPWIQSNAGVLTKNYLKPIKPKSFPLI